MIEGWLLGFVLWMAIWGFVAVRLRQINRRETMRAGVAEDKLNRAQAALQRLMEPTTAERHEELFRGPNGEHVDADHA